MADRGSGSGGYLPMGLVAFAAVVYSLLPGGSTTPSGSSATDAASSLFPPAPREAAITNTDPLKPVYDFLEVLGSKHEKGETTTCREPGRTAYRIRFLIATVPDPLDSHLAYLFDRAVDAIQKGAGDSGYVLDRLFFPWKKDMEARWNVAFNEPGSADGLLTVRPKPLPGDLHSRTPGVLLFRKGENGDDAPTLLVVFLVGEVPTSGIQREPFVRALDAIVDGSSSLPCAPISMRGKIDVLGPYFSGSADSLRNAILGWRSEPGHAIYPFEILSGSATADRNQEVLCFDESPFPFHATVPPNNPLQHTLYAFLDTLGITPSEDVALFVEASTQYGSGFREGLRPHAPHLVFQFPLHVSQLRAAYERDEGLKSGGVLNRSPRHTLELPLETSDGNPVDILPPQDPRMSSVAAEMSLATSIETIRRERIRVVGIVATDPRDVLFLARKLREAHTNATLFTLGADTLFVHPDYQRYLRGMLVATPYPLFPINQEWTGAGTRRIAFPGQSEEGIYNAFAFFETPDDPSDDNPPPQIEYGAPIVSAGSRRPPIWITAVGRGSFWPVAVFPSYANGYVRAAERASISESPRAHSHWPFGAALVILLVNALFASFVVLYVQVRQRGRSGRLARAEELFSNWSLPLSERINHIYLVTFFSIALIAQMTLASWFAASLQFLSGPYANLGCRFALCLLAPLAFIVLQELVRVVRRELQIWFRSRRKNRVDRVLPYFIPFVLVGFIGVAAIPYWRQTWCLGSGDGLLFAFRALDLTSSLSPIVPFFLATAVLMLWAVSGLHRAFLIEVWGNPDTGDDKASPPSFAGTIPLYDDVIDCIRDWRTRLVMVLVPILALVPFFRTVFGSYTTIDGPAWSRLLHWLLLACFFVVMYDFSLFVLLWIRLRRLLRRLAVHPIAHAFERLPSSCAATPWKLWHAIPNLTTLSASVDLLRTLVNLGSGQPPGANQTGLANEAKTAEGELATAFRECTQSFVASIWTQRELRDTLSRANRLVIGSLLSEWSKWPGEAAKIKLRDPDELKIDERVAGTPAWIARDIPKNLAIWTRTAEELVALRTSAFIRLIFLHLKNLLTFVFLGFILILVAMSSYPFEPKFAAMTLAWVVGLISIGLIAWAFIDMERDPILSFIGKTDPGKVTLSLDFLSSMGIYVVIPLLTLVATQFPGIGDVIYSVFNPAMRSLSH